MQNNYNDTYNRGGSPFHQEPRKSGSARKILFFVFIMISLFFTMYFIQHGSLPMINLPTSLTSGSLPGRPISSPPGPLGADEMATIEIFKRCSSSVVFITSIVQQRDFFTLRPLEIPQGTGSGFMWDEEGHIVTNFHVIYNADSLSVTLSDQTVLPASVRGIDPDHDLAVLKVETTSENLHPLLVGRSSDLQVGQKVLAIGNPFGLDSTLTTGIISALGRSIRSMNDRLIHGVIQTDAAINPGNSGGPLLDSFGRLIGVNTAIISPSGVNAGVGFAVPVDTINRIVPQLIAKGRVSRAGLGVVTFNDDFLARYRIKGALIRQVTPGGAAELAGLRGTYQTREGIVLGDIIIAIDEKEIGSSTDLIDAVSDREVGETITIDYVRSKKKYRVSAILQEI